jgi:hypothetical protein
MGPDCPIYGDNNRNNNNHNNNRGNNRNGRWVFQVTVGDFPESGKVSDDQA